MHTKISVIFLSSFISSRIWLLWNTSLTKRLVLLLLVYSIKVENGSQVFTPVRLPPNLQKIVKRHKSHFLVKFLQKNNESERTKSTRSLVIVSDKKGGEILIMLFHRSVLRRLLRLLLIRLMKFYRHLCWIWWFFKACIFEKAILVDFFLFAFFGYSFTSLSHILYKQEEGPGIILPLNRSSCSHFADQKPSTS